MTMKKKIKIKSGRFAGREFKLEGTIAEVCGDNCLPLLAMQGNWAAKNACDIDGYNVYDEPFYYGKIGGLGCILSAKDLGLDLKPMTHNGGAG